MQVFMVSKQQHPRNGVGFSHPSADRPRTEAPRHLAGFKVQLSLTVCAGVQPSSSEEFCSGGSSLPWLCSGPAHVLRWLPLSLINRRPAQRHHPAGPGCLAQPSGRWSPLPRWRLNWKVTLCWKNRSEQSVCALQNGAKDRMWWRVLAFFKIYF